MSNDEVIELSIEETNKLRIELGLKPLRVSTGTSTSTANTNTHGTSNTNTNTNGNGSGNGNSDEINLSIEESNALRSKLGLPPLRNSSNVSTGRKASEAIHAPASNTREEDDVRKRIEEAKLKREVEAGLAKMRKSAMNRNRNRNDNGSESESKAGGALSWVEKMRSKKDVHVDGDVDKNTKKSKKIKSNTNNDNDIEMKEYTNDDLKDQNITVSHATNEFEAGTTTILTLADKSILDAEEEGEDGNALENVNMTETATLKDHLKKKRMMEMGGGHAGGYAGYDDDEFEELGGGNGGGGGMTLGMNRSTANGNGGSDDTNKKRGFKLGHHYSANEDTDQTTQGRKSDLFDSFAGKSVSLVSTTTNNNNNSSRQADFMTYEEEESMGINTIDKEDMEKRRKKKEKKLLKKLKKKEKKAKKDKNHDVEESKPIPEATNIDAGTGTGTGTTSLLDDLEGSAANNTNGKNKKQRKRKRHRVTEDSDEEDEPQQTNNQQDNNQPKETAQQQDDDAIIQQKRKNKFNTIMEKGNTRTDNIFKLKKGNEMNSNEEQEDKIEEDTGKDDDDAFLLAALSKARRLRRLRELNANSNSVGVDEQTNTKSNGTTGGGARGADAVVQSIRSMKHEIINNDGNKNDKMKKDGRITFELDVTKEFTRTLRSQEAKTEKSVEKMKEMRKEVSSDDVVAVATNTIDKELTSTSPDQLHDKTDEKEEDQPVVSLEELADEVKEDHQDNVGGFGDTSSTVPVGRGLSNFLSILKHTGDITGKNAGKEELRGRAKDERNYEDYAKLDLKNVVKIDRTGSAHKKDLELANREVKLEYRDEHGRLLTRKEAYRNLCYQFHGHGSSSKNEEKRLRQVERERKEGSFASKHDNSGTLGALKATQRATGKAFVLHKT